MSQRGTYEYYVKKRKFEEIYFFFPKNDFTEKLVGERDFAQFPHYINKLIKSCFHGNFSKNRDTKIS